MMEQTTAAVELHHYLKYLPVCRSPRQDDKLKKVRLLRQDVTKDTTLNKIRLVRQGVTRKAKLVFVVEQGIGQGAVHLPE